MATIRDVARKAKVSIATVSRVFNDSGKVKEATRRRIRAAATTLRYVPDGAARTLSTGKTSTVGVLLPDIWGEFFSEIIRGIDLTARNNEYHLLLSSSHDDQDAIEAAMHTMRGRVDGLIIMCPDLDSATLAANLPADLPVVLLDCVVDKTKGRTRFDSLTVDNFGGARAMVRHLASLGHKRIAIIKGPTRNQDARDRLRGYRAALRQEKLDAPDEVQLNGDFTEASGYHAALDLLNLRQPPTAIFASNDSMAIGALSALRAKSVRVPRDIAVAGFDDIPIARYATPTLSSVRVPISELGRRATETLLDSIQSNGRRRTRLHETLKTTLVIRQSCGGDEN
jgi:LacI family transcriptional regulator